MDYFFALAGGKLETRWGRVETLDFGFFTRAPDPLEVARIRQEADPEHKRLVVFYGLGMSIHHGEFASQPIWDNEDCVFLVSSHVHVEKPNVIRMPASYTESQNYVAAADLVITKPGWSTVSEAYCFSKPLFLVQRDGFREDTHTMQYLSGRAECTLLSLEQVGELQLEASRYRRLMQDHEMVHKSTREIDAILDRLQLVLAKEGARC